MAQRSERQGFVISVIEFEIADADGGARTHDDHGAGRCIVSGERAVDADDHTGADRRLCRSVGRPQPDPRRRCVRGETPFGGTIAHGMLVLALIGEMMHETHGEAWLTSGRLKVRFKAPTRPGDTVTASATAMKETDDAEYSVHARTETARCSSRAARA